MSEKLASTKILKQFGTWQDVYYAACRTEGKEIPNKEPSKQWKKRILLSEHSPIRAIRFWVDFKNVKSWVIGHLVRHKIGAEHFVSTQRTDRTGVNRDDLPQSNPVDMLEDQNAQALINVSRKRLCFLASPETQVTWHTTVKAIVSECPEFENVLVPDCVYRGHCFEMRSCGWFKTEEYKTEREIYISQVNND